MKARAGSPDRQIRTDEELRECLSRISFYNTVVDFHWQFKFRPIVLKPTDAYPQEENAWLLWAEFERPDTHTGEIGIGRGRDEIVLVGSWESGVIKTCWLLVELLVRHELMEGFQVDGLRIFDPHNSVADLQLAQQIGTRKAER
jgi:hypothetical protein